MSDAANVSSFWMFSGWGCYQKFLIGLCSAYMFCNGFAYVAFFFVIPIAKCDLLLNSEEEMCVIVNLILGKIAK